MSWFKKAQTKKQIVKTQIKKPIGASASTELTMSEIEQVAGGKPAVTDIHFVKQVDQSSAKLN